MPSNPAFTSLGSQIAPPVTGRCYCGKTSLSASTPPIVTTYCHCHSCRRLTGGPVAAFSAFAKGDIDISPAPQHAEPVSAGVDRWFCARCGTALAATYDYLPDQVYVPIGVIDQADDFAPTQHCHAGSAMSWLHIADDLPRATDSARASLNASCEKSDR
ncbi:MAG: hypothetical protein ACI9PY_000308 [Ascidiaceihabitans sp.]